MTTVLLTGASGYIGKHIALQLLEAGYDVRASVRSPSKADEVVAALSAHLADPTVTSRLSFVHLDLTSDDGWNAALEGVDVLLHTASPFSVDKIKDENVLIRPAVDGTLRALRAAKAAGVTRVVVTSSNAAIQGAVVPPGPTTYDETFWTDVTSPIGRDPYTKSKTLAERAAWDFVATEAPEINLTTINPGLVVGAPLDRNYATSVEVIERVLAAKDPAMPDLSFPLVDVRDVAAMHVRCIDRPVTYGQRYLAAAGTYSFVQIARTLKAAFPDRKLVTRQAPNFLIRFLGLFDGQIKSIIPMLSKQMSFNASKATRDLDITFIDPATSLVETATFLLAEK